MRKFLLILLTLLSASLAVQAQRVEQGGLIYEYTGGDEVSVVGHTEDCPNDLTIPARIEIDGTEFAVTSIGRSAFYAFTGLESVTISDGVRTIKNGAFSSCRNLSSITFPKDYIDIWDHAFSTCLALVSVEFPLSVSISKFAFGYCENLKTVYLKSVMSIEQYAFQTCDKLFYVIADGISPQAIPAESFDSAPYATLYVPEEAISRYAATEGWNTFRYIEKYTPGMELMTVEGDILYGLLPGDKAFAASDNRIDIIEADIKTNVTIGGKNCTVNEIISRAFRNCLQLRFVNIPSTVTSIGADAFRSADNLAIVTVGIDAPIALSEGTFMPNDNTCLYVPRGKKDAYADAEGWNAFPNIIEAASVADASVWHDGIMYAVNGDETAFASYADRDIQHAKIKESVNIGSRSYIVNTMAQRLFDRCAKLESVEFPESVTAISIGAFEGCKTLKSIVIPNHITSIGDWAFSGCFALESVNIPPKVISIGNSVFRECRALTGIVIPDNITSIGDYAFSHCVGLTNLNIPTCVTGIGEFAFNQCRELASINIPVGVTEIKLGTFYGCEKLPSIDIPSTVTSIGGMAFASCKSLTEIEIPSSVTYLDYRVFWNCKNLKKVTLSEELTTLNAGLFGGCTALESINIPASITSIGNMCFLNCTSLAKITSKAVTPPACEADVFRGVDYDECRLSVPDSSVDAYKQAEEWKNFIHIDAMVMVGIDDALADDDAVNVTGRYLTAGSDAIVVAVYTLDGRMTDARVLGAGESMTLPCGACIITVNGRARKSMIR